MADKIYSDDELRGMQAKIQAICAPLDSSNWVGGVSADYDEDFNLIGPLKVGLDGGFTADQLRRIADVMEGK